MATIKDVAELAGVSSTTVSHVINRTRAVNSQTAARVWAAIERLKFSPSTLARNLRMKSTLTIGVVSDYAGNPFFSEVVAGIEEVCFDHNYSVFLSFSESDPAKETQVVHNLLRRGVEGLIWQPYQPDAGITDLAAHVRVPLVTFQRTLPEWNCDALMTDDGRGGRDVMAHLLGLGHRRIALVTGETFASHATQLRERGYRDALTGAGLPVDESLICLANYTFDGAYAVTQSLLALASPPTAFFCISDRMALGCLAALQDAGLRVPQDASLVGYDNLELLNYVRPRLTTVDHGGRESGRRMARRLLERIKDQTLLPEKLVSEPRLLVRETSGPCPK
jgi:LacI family transcriptional regulator